MTKEDKTEYMREYRKKNRDKLNAYARERRANKADSLDKELQRARQKRYKDSLTLDYYIVYALPNEHYCGVTNQPTLRMRYHNTRGKSTDDWFILDVCHSLAHARLIEREHHNNGWNGKQGHKHFNVELNN